MQDRILLIRQLATSLQAGLTVEHALALQAGHSGPRMRGPLAAAAQAVRRGQALSLAMRPLGLEREDLALIRMGEQSGHLADLLKQLADEVEANHHFRREIRGGLAYPAFMIVSGVLVAPLAQLVLQGPGAYARGVLPGLVGVGLLFIAMAWVSRRHVGRKIAMALPGWGALLRQARLRRFATSLAMAYRAGIPLAQALLTLGETSEDPRVRQAAVFAGSLAQNGQPISTAFARYPDLFSAPFMQMLRTGEASGAIDTVLFKFAGLLEHEIDSRRKVIIRFTGLIALLLALGWLASRILGMMPRLNGLS